MIPWEFKATQLVTCNCDWGCPCQFNALPTHGNCEAMWTIFTGGETEVGATVFNVFAATYEEVFDPVYKAIDLSIDVDARVGHVTVAGVGQCRAKPILNPVTGEEHRARINLPDGFEYTVAEMGNGTFETSGPITLSNEDSYAQFSYLHMNNQGVVRDQAA